MGRLHGVICITASEPQLHNGVVARCCNKRPADRVIATFRLLLTFDANVLCSGVPQSRPHPSTPVTTIIMTLTAPSPDKIIHLVFAKHDPAFVGNVVTFGVYKDSVTTAISAVRKHTSRGWHVLRRETLTRDEYNEFMARVHSDEVM